MLIVLNEWIFHDFWNANGKCRQRETVSFLRTLANSADRLVVLDESPWIGKAYQLMTLVDPHLRLISQEFRRLCVDSDKALWVPWEGTGRIPCELLTQLPEEDVYLVAAYLVANADVLVTVDVQLYDALASTELVDCRMRDDFLADYLA